MLGMIFEKAQNKIQDPALLRKLIVELIGREGWSAMADVVITNPPFGKKSSIVAAPALRSCQPVMRLQGAPGARRARTSRTIHSAAFFLKSATKKG